MLATKNGCPDGAGRVSVGESATHPQQPKDAAMTVIVVASHKGGVGKTTIALLLSEELAHRGFRVGIVEADRERHIANYLAGREREDRAANFELYSDEDADTLGATIRRAEGEHDIVVVDLPGFQGLMFTRAVARANLVLIPMRPTAMDNTSASNAIDRIHIEADHLDRNIPHRIVLNMVQDAGKRERAVGVTTIEKELRKHIANNGFPVMDAELTLRRGAFVAFYGYAMTPHEMLEETPSESLEKAHREVQALAEETLAILSADAASEPTSRRAAG